MGKFKRTDFMKNKTKYIIGFIILILIFIFLIIDKNSKIGSFEFILVQKIEMHLKNLSKAFEEENLNKENLNENLYELSSLNFFIGNNDELNELYKEMNKIFDDKYRLNLLDKDKIENINKLYKKLDGVVEDIHQSSEKFIYKRGEDKDSGLATYYYLRSNKFKTLFFYYIIQFAYYDKNYINNKYE